jgi:hypothetical protein
MERFSRRNDIMLTNRSGAGQELRMKINSSLFRISALIVGLILMLSWSISCIPALTSSQLLDRVSPYPVQVAIIATNLDDGRPFIETPVGNAFFINADGYIITANHIIEASQQYLQQIHAQNKDLYVVIPPYKGLAESSPVPPYPPGNLFDIVARDEPHDLILLKMRIKNVIEPFKGTVVGLVQYGNGTGGNLAAIKKPLSLNPSVSKNSKIGASGYPSQDFTLVSAVGRITSSETVNLANVKFSNTPEGFTIPELRDVYYTDLPANQGDSGELVYALRNGVSAGVGIKIVQSDGSSMMAIVPAKFAIKLFDQNGVKWTKAR